MRTLLLLSPLALAHALAAQDLFAVGTSGGWFQADTATCSAEQVGPGRTGLHGLATDGVNWWSVDYISLVTIDPRTGAATAVLNTNDYVSLTWDQGSATLYGLRQGTYPRHAIVDRVDPRTGAATQVATWTFLAAYANQIAFWNGSLWGWDTMAGLLHIDLATGAVVQVMPTPTMVAMRFLCAHPDGRLLCGIPFGPATDLGVIDPATGTMTDLGHMSTTAFGGCVALGASRTPVGQACNDVLGPATLRVTGTCLSGTAVRAVSNNHALGTIGMMLFGWSTTNWGSLPLPLSLDPLFGTSGCALNVSPDATLFGATPSVPPGDLAFTFALPPATAGLAFAVQHAALAPVPGSESWSNGVAIRVLQ